MSHFTTFGSGGTITGIGGKRVGSTPNETLATEQLRTSRLRPGDAIIRVGGRAKVARGILQPDEVIGRFGGNILTSTGDIVESVSQRQQRISETITEAPVQAQSAIIESISKISLDKFMNKTTVTAQGNVQPSFSEAITSFFGSIFGSPTQKSILERALPSGSIRNPSGQLFGLQSPEVQAQGRTLFPDAEEIEPLPGLFPEVFDTLAEGTGNVLEDALTGIRNSIAKLFEELTEGFKAGLGFDIPGTNGGSTPDGGSTGTDSEKEGIGFFNKILILVGIIGASAVVVSFFGRNK